MEYDNNEHQETNNLINHNKIGIKIVRNTVMASWIKIGLFARVCVCVCVCVCVYMLVKPIK